MVHVQRVHASLWVPYNPLCKLYQAAQAALPLLPQACCSPSTSRSPPPCVCCSEIIKLPPGALKGLKEGKADDMLAAFNIKTIEALGTWKHYQAAKAISVLAATEEAGRRPAAASANINGIVDKAFEAASLKEIMAAPPSALQGLAPW